MFVTNDELIVLKPGDVFIQPISNVCSYCKKIICIITFSHYLAHTASLFMSLNILQLEKIFYHSMFNFSVICQE